MNRFGIYILTYPKDYYLAETLISSIRYYHPELSIMVVPGTGFDINNHPFGNTPILRNTIPEWNSFEFYDRKFWIFGGPFERFIYMDSDMLCVKPFHSLIQSVMSQKEPFMYVNVEPEMLNFDSFSELRIKDINSRIEGGQLGDIKNMGEFDPAFNADSVYPFNSGLLAASKSSFDIGIFNDFRNNLYSFYKNKLHCDYNGRCFKLFFGDQGQLIYLSHKMNIKLLSFFPDNYFVWGGDHITISVEDLKNGNGDFNFIHWAGCPRPSKSLFNRGALLKYKLHLYKELGYSFASQKEVPGLSAWEYFCHDNGMLQTGRHTCADLADIAAFHVRRYLRKCRPKRIKT